MIMTSHLCCFGLRGVHRPVRTVVIPEIRNWDRMNYGVMIVILKLPSRVMVQHVLTKGIALLVVSDQLVGIQMVLY